MRATTLARWGADEQGTSSFLTGRQLLGPTALRAVRGRDALGPKRNARPERDPGARASRPRLGVGVRFQSGIWDFFHVGANPSRSRLRTRGTRSRPVPSPRVAHGVGRVTSGNSAVVKSQCGVHVEPDDAPHFRRQLRHAFRWHVQILIFLLPHPAEGIGQDHAVAPVP